MGAEASTHTLGVCDSKKEEKPVSKLSDEELFQDLEEETDGFFKERYTSRYLFIYSKLMTEYIRRCHNAKQPLDKLYTLLDKYNTPYFIENVALYSFRVRFICVPVEKPQSALSS